jgi:hypothetical protein
MESKHTPGPWVVIEDHPQNACAEVVAERDFFNCGICTLYSGESDDAKCDPVTGIWGDHPERRANAHLISAAPDMLEALRRCVDNLERALRDGYEGVWSEDDFAENLAPYRAAIAKAEGSI